MDRPDFVGQVDTARQVAGEAQTPRNLLALAKGLHSLARYLANHDHSYAEALGFYEEAASIFAKIGDARGEARAYFEIGVAYELGFEDYGLAARYVRRALDLVNDNKTRRYYQQELDCLQVNRLKKGNVR